MCVIHFRRIYFFLKKIWIFDGGNGSPRKSMLSDSHPNMNRTYLDQAGIWYAQIRRNHAFYYIRTREKRRISEKLVKRMKHLAHNQYLSPLLDEKTVQRPELQCKSQIIRTFYSIFTWRKRFKKCLLMTSITIARAKTDNELFWFNK